MSPYTEPQPAELKIELPPITRPNGKPYQPVSIRASWWESQDTGEAGVVVLGTHDVDVARPIAEQYCEYWHGARYAIKPRTGWWRLGYGGYPGELSWLDDPVKAPAGVMFEASNDPEEER